eukprot:gnl/Trimastix_PCT/1006.p2 GENE.gnl/Trimastix_PCT/1006~~gnl/Trimastix_PCT/1006.p2  ORF type:complete len:275 (+),score=96.10 gnl/Trimastix_PCT/1006:48-827(+)
MAEQRKAEALRFKEQGNAALQSKDYQTAVQQYTRAIELDPNNHIFRSNRSAAYFSMNLFEKAVEDANWCVELKPDWSKGYYRKGIAHKELGQIYEARLAFRKGLERDPGNLDIQSALVQLPDNASAAAAGPTIEERKSQALKFKGEGNTHFQARRWQKAYESYSRAIELDPSVMVFFNNRSACLLELNRVEEALADTKKAAHLGTQNNDPARLIAKAYLRMGTAYMRLNQKREAAVSFREAMRHEDSQLVRQKLREAES